MSLVFHTLLPEQQCPAHSGCNAEIPTFLQQEAAQAKGHNEMSC